MLTVCISEFFMLCLLEFKCLLARTRSKLIRHRSQRIRLSVAIDRWMCADLLPRLVIETLRQPSRLRGPSEVVRGFSKEARTRGFPSPSLGGFGFIGVVRAYAYYVNYATRFGLNVRFLPQSGR